MSSPLIVDVFINFFLNIVNIMMVLIFLLVGVLAGIAIRPRARNHVSKFIPRDHRFIDFNIVKESAVSLVCSLRKPFPPQRFFKLRSGYTGQIGKFVKRTITRYLGMEGTAYTWRLESGQDIPLGTLWEAVKTVWGPKFYNSVPKKQRDLLEKSQIGVTVDLESGPSNPPGFTKVSEEDIKKEEDREAAETFWKGKKTAEKFRIIEYFFIGGTGFAICAVCVLLGLFG